MSAEQPDPSRSQRPVHDLSYTEASEELDGIVAFFEQREVDVDQLVTRLERATELVAELDRRLRRTRAQVERLVPRLEAATDETPTPAEDDTDEAGSSESETRVGESDVNEHTSEGSPIASDGDAGPCTPGRTPGLF